MFMEIKGVVVDLDKISYVEFDSAIGTITIYGDGVTINIFTNGEDEFNDYYEKMRKVSEKHNGN